MIKAKKWLGEYWIGRWGGMGGMWTGWGGSRECMGGVGWGRVGGILWGVSWINYLKLPYLFAAWPFWTFHVKDITWSNSSFLTVNLYYLMFHFVYERWLRRINVGYGSVWKIVILVKTKIVLCERCWLWSIKDSSVWKVLALVNKRSFCVKDVGFGQ